MAETVVAGQVGYRVSEATLKCEWGFVGLTPAAPVVLLPHGRCQSVKGFLVYSSTSALSEQSEQLLVKRLNKSLPLLLLLLPSCSLSLKDR